VTLLRIIRIRLAVIAAIGDRLVVTSSGSIHDHTTDDDLFGARGTAHTWYDPFSSRLPDVADRQVGCFGPT